MCEVSGDCPRVSVVMAVRDAAGTVEAAVDSVIGQTFGDFEFIVVDDGSRDGSVEIVQRVAAVDSRVCIVAREREGFVESLVHGTGLARGEYIARMDADDVAISTRFERQVASFDSDPKLAVVGSLVEIVSDGSVGSGMRRYEEWINGLCSHEDICRELFVESPLAHPSVMMRAEAVRAVGGYRVRPEWPEDYDLWMRMWRAGYRFGKVEEPLLRWRYSPESLSQTDSRYLPERFIAVKLHYLQQSYLQDEPREIMLCGAGAVGKRWIQALGREGMPVGRAIDVAPRKIGRTIHGARVIGVEDIPPPDDAFILCAVGAPGARPDIRAELIARGYTECRDFLFVA